MKAAILYDSKSGNTKRMAELICEGMEHVDGVTAKAYSIKELDENWVQESSCIVIGSPTYYADLSASMKGFLEKMGTLSLAGKLGGAFSTAGFVYGGGDLAIETILRHMMFYGMMVYSSGCTQNPPIHLGPVAVNGIPETETVFTAYGERMAAQAAKLFK